jgi:hypothetical protein
VKTQIAFSEQLNKGKYETLLEQARRLGVIRSEVWQRFGSLKGVGLGDRTIRDNWLKEGRQFNVPANAWKQTLADAIGMPSVTLKPIEKRQSFMKTSSHRQNDCSHRCQCCRG